ncbi:MAG: OmpA family protein, partial [Bacteroidota bacterium]
KEILEGKDYTALLNLIENAINNTDSLALNLLNLNTVYDEITTEEYFYHMDGDSAYLIMTVIGNDTLWTLPGLNTRHTITDENIYKLTIRNDTIIDNALLKENDLNNIEPGTKELLIYFDLNSIQIKQAYTKELEKLVQTMKADNDYKLSIKGYADFRGEDEYNLLLSKKRAETVKQFFTAHGVNKSRILAKGLGEIASGNDFNEKELEKNRRVELQIFKETE